MSPVDPAARLGGDPRFWRVLLYVLLDGFDLGVGILFPLRPTTATATR